MRGNEDILQALENDWEAVKLQTGWQLEYCTKTIVNPSPTDPLPTAPMATMQCETPANHRSLTVPVSNSNDVSDSSDGDSADAPANSFFRELSPGNWASTSIVSNLCNNTLKVLYYNSSRSIVHEVDELRSNCLLYKPDIICITETWLDSIRGGSRGGFSGLQPPQTILSNPTHLHTRPTIAWHSSSHCMVSSRQAV